MMFGNDQPKNLTEDQSKRLKQAADLIAGVQIELLHTEEAAKTPRHNETWRDLYWVRIKLGEFMHYGFCPTRL